MLAKYQADVDSQYLTNCRKLDRKMGVGPTDRGGWEEKLRDYHTRDRLWPLWQHVGARLGTGPSDLRGAGD